jgi:hypothetical protein
VTFEDNVGLETSSQRDQFLKKLPIGPIVGPAYVAALAVHIMTNAASCG